jgi:hypothetical protein
MTFIIFGCILIAISVIISIIIVQKALKKNKTLQKKYEEQEKIYNDKIKAIENIDNNILIEKENYERYIQELSSIRQNIKIENSSLNEAKIMQANLNGNIERAKVELDNINNIVKQQQEQIENLKENQQSIVKQCEEDFQNRLSELISNYELESEICEDKLNDLREKRNAAIQVAISEYESNTAMGFYSLQLADNEISDIRLLRQLEDKISKKEVLGKIIYKCYIEKHYTDLIGRVLNKEHFSGIYKITNQMNQMCYIGQSTDLVKRWQQHIKRAIGAEPLTNNKLYPAMREFGIENFTFEVVDRCEKDKLNEREQYWQEFYQAKTFGYSIK